MAGLRRKDRTTGFPFHLAHPLEKLSCLPQARPPAASPDPCASRLLGHTAPWHEFASTDAWPGRQSGLHFSPYRLGGMVCSAPACAGPGPSTLPPPPLPPCPHIPAVPLFLCPWPFPQAKPLYLSALLLPPCLPLSHLLGMGGTFSVIRLQEDASQTPHHPHEEALSEGAGEGSDRLLQWAEGSCCRMSHLWAAAKGWSSADGRPEPSLHSSGD